MTVSKVPNITVALRDWAHAQAAETAGISIEPGFSFREDPTKGSATVEGATQQRLGYLTLWASGELDCQVVRRADDLLVLNEHRVVADRAGVLEAAEAFRLVLGYVDPRE
jgi:hypothetical protein